MKSWCNGALGGYKDAVKSAVEIFLAEGPKRGLELSTDHAVQNVQCGALSQILMIIVSLNKFLETL